MIHGEYTSLLQHAIQQKLHLKNSIVTHCIWHQSYKVFFFEWMLKPVSFIINWLTANICPVDMPPACWSIIWSSVEGIRRGLQCTCDIISSLFSLFQPWSWFQMMQRTLCKFNSSKYKVAAFDTLCIILMELPSQGFTTWTHICGIEPFVDCCDACLDFLQATICITSFPR